MTDRTARTAVRAAAVAGAFLALAGAAIVIVGGNVSLWWPLFGGFITLLAVFFGLFAWLVAPSQAQNRVVWVMAASSVLFGINGIGAALAAQLVPDPGLVLRITVVPSDLTSGAATVLLITGTGAVAGLIPLLTFGVLLFPDGRLPSARWKPVGVLSGWALLVSVAGSIWSYRPWNTGPADSGIAIDVSWATIILISILSLASLVNRFRMSSGETRQQIKWIVWGAAIFVPVMILGILLGQSRHADLVVAPVVIAGAALVTSYGVAIGRYRLFEIDRVVNRTVVYGIVVAVLAVVYVGAVFLLRDRLPFEGDFAVALSTVIVAGLFNPLRTRVQAFVDRSFYRSRYDAQRVVDRFSGRMHGVANREELLRDLVGVVDQTLHPETVHVWVPPAPPARKRRHRRTRPPDREPRSSRRLRTP